MRGIIINIRFKKYSRRLTLVSKYGYRLQTRECAVFRSDISRGRGIAFPATFLLTFLVVQPTQQPRAIGVGFAFLLAVRQRLSRLALLSPAASVARMAEAPGGTERRTET